MCEEKTARELASLRATLRILRGKGGCPWDRERTLPEIASHMIDEAYEFLEAAQSGSPADMEEELGDVALMLVFAHELILERNGAGLHRIIASVHEKIVERHPHVFGKATVKDTAGSNAQWEMIKNSSRPSPRGGSVMDDVPESLPPVRRSHAIQKKAASIGFDWPDHEGVLGKLDEEVAELREAIASAERTRVADEMGDVLFTVINLSRLLGVDPEAALSATNSKFSKRFISMEERIRASGREPSELTLEEMERYWQASK